MTIVGGFNPVEKYSSNWMIFPGSGENKTYLKPPPRWIKSANPEERFTPLHRRLLWRASRWDLLVRSSWPLDRFPTNEDLRGANVSNEFVPPLVFVTLHPPKTPWSKKFKVLSPSGYQNVYSTTKKRSTHFNTSSEFFFPGVKTQEEKTFKSFPSFAPRFPAGVSTEKNSDSHHRVSVKTPSPITPAQIDRLGVPTMMAATLSYENSKP